MKNERDITNLKPQQCKAIFFFTNVRELVVCCRTPLDLFLPSSTLLFRINLFSDDPQHTSPISLEKRKEEAGGTNLARKKGGTL